MNKNKDKFQTGQTAFKVYEKGEWEDIQNKHWLLVGNKKKHFIVPVRILNTPSRRQKYFNKTYDEHYTYDCYNEYISSYGYCMGHCHFENSLFSTYDEALKYIKLIDKEK